MKENRISATRAIMADRPRLTHTARPRSSQSCTSGPFSRPGVSDRISASFAEYGRLGALAQCSKVKRHLREVIKLKEGVICQKGHVKWIGRRWTERPRERPPPTIFPSFPSVPLHLVRTSFPAGACSFRGVVLPALQNACCVPFLQLKPRKCVWTGRLQRHTHNAFHSLYHQ